MLTAEERDALLFEHMEHAEKEAQAFLRSVRKVLSTDRFVGAAYTGLVLATRTYDPTRGESFKAHAWSWILDYLTQQFQKEWRTQSKETGAVYQQRELFDNTVVVKHNTMIAQHGALECFDSIGSGDVRTVTSRFNGSGLLEAVRENI